LTPVSDPSVPPVSDSLVRRVIRTIVLSLAIVGSLWTTSLVLFGGIETRILGVRITSNDFRRTLLYAAMLFTIYILTGTTSRIAEAWPSWLRRLRERSLDATATDLGVRFLNIRAKTKPEVFAVLLTLAVLVVTLTWHVPNAGGADSYGYVSQADLWLSGHLKVSQPFVELVPWPDAAWTFSPLGYRPLPDGTIVPTYSPGLPLLMAGAKAVAGHCAAFWVTPICGGLLVLTTFGIGKRLGSGAVGLIGAWLLATSPTFLFNAIVPMSDVPVAAMWAASFWLILRGSFWSALGAGLVTALAVMIRTNLAPMAAICPMWLAIQFLRDAGPARRGRMAQLAGFVLGVLPGPLVVAMLNTYLYSSPFRSGYGHVKDIYARKNVPQNLHNYALWLLETQTVVFFAGVVALVAPFRRLWPFVKDRWIIVAFALFVFGIYVQYLFYEVFDSSMFLRFLLPCYPFVLLGLAAVVQWLASLKWRLLTLATYAGVIVLGLHGFDLAKRGALFEDARSETKYELAGRLVARIAPPNSIVMSMQHSGTIRYYGGRLTMRYDSLDGPWLDRAVDWLSERGIKTFVFVEDWEVPRFQKRFAGQRFGSLNMKPLVIYRNASAEMFLYDLSRPVSETFVQKIEEDFLQAHCLPPAPRLRIPIK
jgi:hypothetical protein